MKFLSALILFVFTTRLQAQDYIAYQHTFNRVDEDLFNNRYEQAIKRLDSIYFNYQFIYARHCIKSLQVCCKSGDSLRADKWLVRCFKQGVPLWIIRNNGLTKKVFQYATSRQTIQRYDSFHAIYESSINLVIARQIDSLIAIDQKYTWKVNNDFLPLRYTIDYLQWRKNNSRQFKIIQDITSKYGFPGERLIGLPPLVTDSSNWSRHMMLYGPWLYENRAYIMLIHCYSNPRQTINEQLYPNVVNGFLPAFQYGALNDFMARWGNSDNPYYNVWHHDPETGHLQYINDRRQQIGLNDFATQEKNEMISLDRRKNRVANSEIIIE